MNSLLICLCISFLCYTAEQKPTVEDINVTFAKNMCDFIDALQYEQEMKLADQVLQNCPPEIDDLLFSLNNIHTYKDVAPKAVLFLGKPGLGKSTAAIAIAKKTKIPYTFVACTLLANEYQNSGAQNLYACVYPVIEKQDPHIIILDEINAIVEKTDKDHNRDALMAFLNIFDILKEKNPYATIIATTNSIEKFPDQIRSRFGMCIEFKLPTCMQRKSIIKYHFERNNAQCKDSLVHELAQKTRHFAGRDLEYLIHQIIIVAAKKHLSVKNIDIAPEDIEHIWQYSRNNPLYTHLHSTLFSNIKTFIKDHYMPLVTGTTLTCSLLSLYMQSQGLQFHRASLSLQTLPILQENHQIVRELAINTAKNAARIAGVTIPDQKYLCSIM